MNPRVDLFFISSLFDQSKLIQKVVHTVVFGIQLVIATFGNFIETSHSLFTIAILTIHFLHTKQQQIRYLSAQFWQTFAREFLNTTL